MGGVNLSTPAVVGPADVPCLVLHDHRATSRPRSRRGSSAASSTGARSRRATRTPTSTPAPGCSTPSPPGTTRRHLRPLPGPGRADALPRLLPAHRRAASRRPGVNPRNYGTGAERFIFLPRSLLGRYVNNYVGPTITGSPAASLDASPGGGGRGPPRARHQRAALDHQPHGGEGGEDDAGLGRGQGSERRLRARHHPARPRHLPHLPVGVRHELGQQRLRQRAAGQLERAPPGHQRHAARAGHRPGGLRHHRLRGLRRGRRQLPEVGRRRGHRLPAGLGLLRRRLPHRPGHRSSRWW